MSLPTVLWATAVWATRTMEANELAALGPLWVVLLAVGSVLELGALVIVGLLASLDGVAPNAAERRMLVIALGAIDLCARTLPLLVRNDAGDPHAHPGWALSTLATGAALSWWLSALLTASHSVTMLPWAMVAAAGLHGAVEAMTGANLPVLPMLAGFFVTFEVLRVRAALPWTL